MQSKKGDYLTYCIRILFVLFTCLLLELNITTTSRQSQCKPISHKIMSSSWTPIRFGNVLSFLVTCPTITISSMNERTDFILNKFWGRTITGSNINMYESTKSHHKILYPCLIAFIYYILNINITYSYGQIHVGSAVLTSQ